MLMAFVLPLHEKSLTLHINPNIRQNHNVAKNKKIDFLVVFSLINVRKRHCVRLILNVQFNKYQLESQASHIISE